MMNEVKYLFSYLYDISNFIQAVFGFFSLYGIYAFARDWVSVKINLSIGSFSIKKKHFDVQNITNIVSAVFYDGGQVPPNVRREIIELTCPKIKKLKITK